MPIKVPNNLPAVDILTRENVFVMTDTRAMTQDIRPLQILILNLMPTKVDTETQLTRLLGNTPLQVELELLQTSTHKAHNASEEHMIAFYKTFDQIRTKYYDGMIITGAPVELMEFEEVDYWDELCEIMEWSKTHVHSTLYICWGAQAGLYYHYGIKKYKLPEKLSGVYKHTLEYRTGMLFRGFDDEFYVPHSRNTTVLESEVAACPDIKIISKSPEAGIFAVKSNDDRQIFIMGHSEYDPDTLKKEYLRDLAAGIDPKIPCNYFPDDDPSKEPVVIWRSCANLFYSNWLNYFVYQSTPYDLNAMRDPANIPEFDNGRFDLIVAKFGGSSLADADRVRKVRDIIFDDEKRRFIVVSAPGKSAAEKDKVTDLLFEVADASRTREERAEVLDRIQARYIAMCEDLGVKTDIEGEFARIREVLRTEEPENCHDYIVSRGEYLNALILADFTGYDFVDTAQIIKFDENGRYDEAATMPLLKAELARHHDAVIPGFYGSLPSGQIETFTRGGSDISGSIVAAAAEADIYENWTDVSGILMADPGVVDNPMPVPVITYRELRELAYAGAAVMHPDAVIPVTKLEIPIHIKNTAKPEDPGTMVVNNSRYYTDSYEVAGISGKPGYVSFKAEKEQMNEDPRGREAILEAIGDMGLKIRSTQASLDALTLAIHESELAKISPDVDEAVARLSEAMREACPGAAVSYEKNQALISVVGKALVTTPAIGVKVLSALAGRRINVAGLDHGAEKMTMTITVADADYREAVRAIYHQFSGR